MSGYEVDLSYLQDTYKKLQGIAYGMDHHTSAVNYKTNLSPSQFGGEGFLEADNLYQAHETMKNQLSAMMTTLQTMIQEFTDKTGSAHDQYANTDTSVGDQFQRKAAQ
ncbi:hypothetical protein [Streptacidiphilus anmyonensis]|uniref:hypothetical protein n=1 Tax=Streptacidiphilus anmyonensis TaxID=405782 RepID=UPI0005AA4609|nr:hypothetical protein [Streptacidiphilus anmyonensis]